MNIKLEPLSLKHLDTTHIYASDPDVTKYMFFHNQNKETTMLFLMGVELALKKNPIDYYEFAIMLDEVHVGAISLAIENNIGELGWILNKNYWNKGIVTKSAYLMIDFAKTLNLDKLIANCDHRNIGSYRVMEKIGMKRIKSDGIRRNYHENVDSIEFIYEMKI